MSLGRAAGYLKQPAAAFALAGLVATLALQGAVWAQARPPVTFNRDVAPILYANCTTCHRPGESAPFSLLTYNDARQRARLDFRRHDEPRHAALAARSGRRRVLRRASSGAGRDRYVAALGGGRARRRAVPTDRPAVPVYRRVAARRSGRRRQHARFRSVSRLTAQMCFEISSCRFR